MTDRERIVDVLVVGAGPAGSIAATVLARAGAHVALVDRDAFPRPKLCGDTLNPASLALLHQLELSSFAESRGVRIGGMAVTGEGGIRIEARYPAELAGRSLCRSELDHSLVMAAVQAGVDFKDRVVVREPLVESSGRRQRVVGVRVAAGRRLRELRAHVTVAADGRRSTLAFGLGLLRHPARPRRWAVGAYAENAEGPADLGEMHIRRSHYVGVAPLPGGLTNVCLVMPDHLAERSLGDPLARLTSAVASDRQLASRFARARFAPPVVLGPLAVETIAPPPDGLLLAGDAAGFVDPMTGDGLRFAIRGGILAADAAVDALVNGWPGVVARWQAARDREFRAKVRFNRALRWLVSSPLGVRVAETAVRVAPGSLEALILHASDCHVAAHVSPLQMVRAIARGRDLQPER